MSAWLDHVKATLKANPGTALKDVLKLASKTYKKTKGVVKYAVTGKKSRKGGKAKKSRKVRKGKKSRKGRKGKKKTRTRRRKRR